jgi:hypothetical protein
VRFSAHTEAIPLSDVGGAWVFQDQAVLYTESSCELPRVEHAEVLFDFFDWVVEQVPPIRPPTLIHDWRSLRSLPADVRTAFVERRKRLITVRPERVIVAATLSPIVRMGVQTVALAAEMFGIGVPIDLVDDPGPALRERGALEPDPSLHARLRLAWKRRGGG